MNRIADLLLAALLLLAIIVTPSWGGPPNPTPSDAGGNTAGGSGALEGDESSVDNTAFGVNALHSNTDGCCNTAVGARALLSNTSGTGLETQLSSARYKQEVEPMDTRSVGILQLRPVTFRYTHDVQHVRQYGLLAEEVAAVHPELVTRTSAGEVQAVRYQEFPMLVNGIAAAAAGTGRASCADRSVAERRQLAVKTSRRGLAADARRARRLGVPQAPAPVHAAVGFGRHGAPVCASTEPGTGRRRLAVSKASPERKVERDAVRRPGKSI